MPVIAGKLTDALESQAARGRVVFKPYKTDVRVTGTDAHLGHIVEDIVDVENYTLDAGAWTIEITSAAYLPNSREQDFDRKVIDAEITADTSWAALLEGAAQTPPLTPDLVTQTQQYRDEAEMFAGQAEGVQDAAVSTLIDDPASTTNQRLTATIGTEVTAQTADLLGDGRSVTVADRANGQWGMDLIDTDANAGGILHIDHSGRGGTGSYAIDIRNRQGASIGLVIHNYSATTAAQFDNTDSGTILRLRNAKNETFAPGKKGTGDFIDFWGYTTSSPDQDVQIGRLDQFLVFRSLDPSRVFTFQSQSTSDALRVTSASGGVGLKLNQLSSTSALAIEVAHSAPSTAVQITPSGSAAGFYPLSVTGLNLGPHFSTASDHAPTNGVLNLTKNGTGAGLGLKIVNKGTGNSLSAWSATAEVFAVTAAGLPKWVAAANVQTTVGAAGAASALPAAPSKYLKVVGDDGTTYVVPAYAAS